MLGRQPRQNFIAARNLCVKEDHEPAKEGIIIMPRSLKSELAARQTRMLLVKSGLSEAEAEKLLDRLGKDVFSGDFGLILAQIQSLKSELDDLKATQQLLLDNSSD